MRVEIKQHIEVDKVTLVLNGVEAETIARYLTTNPTKSTVVNSVCRRIRAVLPVGVVT